MRRTTKGIQKVCGVPREAGGLTISTGVGTRRWLLLAFSWSASPLPWLRLDWRWSFVCFHIMWFSVLGFGADVSRRACFRVWFCRCETGSSISEDFAFCGSLDPPVQQESTLVFSFGRVAVFVAYRHNERDACIWRGKVRCTRSLEKV